MINDQKEVYFDKYCPSCVNREEDEFDVNSACFDCLDNPTNQDSHKPVMYKEDKSQTDKKVTKCKCKAKNTSC
jgi:hypothetical protein